MNARPDKCDKCGLFWYVLRGNCPCGGGVIRPQTAEMSEIPTYPRLRAALGHDSAISHSLGRGVCPDCGSTKLRGGPQGGLSQNVLCENCRTEFNAGIISERLAKPCDLQRQKDVYGLEAAHA